MPRSRVRAGHKTKVSARFVKKRNEYNAKVNRIRTILKANKPANNEEE